MIFNSLKAISEIKIKIIISPQMFKINSIKKIHVVLLIELIIRVKVIDWLKIIKFDPKGDLIMVNNIESLKLVKIIILVIMQYVF